MIEHIFMLVSGSILGLSLAAVPGPMNAIIAEESVLGGWIRGFKAGLGAMVADIIFFVLTFVGVAAILTDIRTIHGLLYAFGGFLMIYFAYGSIRNANKKLIGKDLDKENRGFKKAFVLAITNPYQIAWWLSVGIALLKPGTMKAFGYELIKGSPLVILGVFVGITGWITFFPLVLKVTKQKFQKLEYMIAYASAVILSFFGIIFLYNSFDKLIGF